jgi:hypothetical protein
VIVHMLRFSFRDGTSEEDKAKVLAAMRRTASVESASFGTVGQDLGDPAAGYTHAYCVGIKDLETLERYFYDPVHLEGDWHIAPHLQRIVATRLSDDMDPELSQKIMAMHLKKVETYPEWGKAVRLDPGGADHVLRRGVEGVLRGLKTVGHQGLRGVRRAIQEERQLFAFDLGEVP